MPTDDKPFKRKSPRSPAKVRPAKQGGQSGIHDKVWLFLFLVHTLAYLGVSAWINYAVIANDKQPISEDSDLGPIDVYVLDSSSR